MDEADTAIFFLYWTMYKEIDYDHKFVSMGNLPRMAEAMVKCQEREFRQIIMRKASNKRSLLSRGQRHAKKQQKSETLLSSIK